MLFHTGLILFLTFSTGINANIWHLPSIPENQTDVLETWIKLDKFAKSSTNSMIKYMMPTIMESSSQLKLSSKCVKEGLQLVSGLRNLKLWAFSFVDSSGKMIDGLSSGTFSSLGEYDQCLETVVPNSKVKDQILFQGQYCMLEMRLPLPYKTKIYRTYDHIKNLENFTGTEVMKAFAEKAHLMYYTPVRIGLCIPSGCSIEDLNQILNLASKKLSVVAEAMHCEIKQEISFSWIQILTIAYICFLSTLVILGTCIEICSDPKSSSSKPLRYKLFVSFSMISNFKKLPSTKTSVKNFNFLYGVRFLTITWVIEGHAYFFAGYFRSYYRSLFRVQSISTETVAQMILNGSEAVDTFFCMGGMLVAYLTLKRVLVEKKKLNISFFILHRFWRIIPVYYFILLTVTLAPLMGSGPQFYDTMLSFFQPFYKYWWRHVLFISNFFGMKDIGVVQFWYIACDIQLYIASLLVLLPLIKSRKIGIFLNIFIIIASVIYTGIMNYIYDTAPTVTVSHFNIDDTEPFFWATYANPVSRAGPYFIGFFTGYILVMFPDIKIPKKIQVIGWLLAIMSSGMVVFMIGIWNTKTGPTRLELMMYATFYKVAFTAGVAWMFFCCATGHGGIINKILSWKVWVPLSKLTFLIYLIQPIFQVLFIANFRTVQEYTHLHFTVQFFGFLCISTLLALICNLLVESPFLNFEKLLFSRESKTEETDENTINDFDKDDMNIKMKEIMQTVTLENGLDNKAFAEMKTDV